jgi:hypothetical protein
MFLITSAVQAKLKTNTVITKGVKWKFMAPITAKIHKDIHKNPTPSIQ